MNIPGNNAGPAAPAEESRGGERPDWDRARPGEPLPESPPDRTAGKH